MAKGKEKEQIQSCSATVGNVAQYVAYFVILLVICHGSHLLLRPLSQPRIISETIVGLILGNTGFVNNILHITSDPEKVGIKNLKFLTDFGMICYMFALGLDMDPSVLMQVPKREAIVAYAGMISTFIIACSTTPFLRYGETHITSKVFVAALAIVLSSTGSPLLTRLLTDLKIGKSDVGKLAVSAAVHSELVATLLICIGDMIFQPEDNFSVRIRDPSKHKYFTGHAVLPIGLSLLAQVIVAVVVGPIVFGWINHSNPHGKTLKGPHLVLSVAFVVAIGCVSTFVGFSPVLSAFVTGICLPREGRISKFMITKVNYFLGFVFYPFFLLWVGVESKFGKFRARRLDSWERMLCFFAIGTVGKIVGALVSGLMLGFHWPESIALGLLLNVKGHLHMYLAIVAKKNNIITTTTCIGIIWAMLLKIIYIPLVAIYIINRAKKRAPNQKMALQWHDPIKELRILFCLHGPQHVHSAINFMEISKGTGDPGLVVYATDMVQLTDQIAATLAPGEGGVDSVTVTDKTVVHTRQQITTNLQAYLEENGEGITLRRMLALATFNNMHQDICILAEDSMISLIVLPFHKSVETNRETNDVPDGYRYVNRKVLRNAPCSVAILVDRGLNSMNISESVVPLNIAVIFIGGKDDREALAYASRLTHHPRVKVTVVRFLVATDSESNGAATRTTGRTAEKEGEMKLDDECFADFYEKQIAAGIASYSEKHLVNSVQAYSTLRSMEGQYGLFIVGRGGRGNSVLTVGMNDWEQCPELGPLGDILSGPNFSTPAMIIQQHNHRGHPGGADNEFSIM